MKKKKVQKLILSLLTILTLINLFGTVVLATSSGNVTVVDEITESSQERKMNNIWSGLGTVVDGIVGILTTVIRIPALLIVMAGHGILTGIASLGGSTIQGDFLTPDDIFFNRVGLTNINFFDITTSSSAINTIRINVATWYYVMRILAIVILLVILIYIGIRMAISTVASEQAKYKKMLTDWVVSFALVFLLNYIIMFTLEANNALLELLSRPVTITIGQGVPDYLINTAAWGKATSSWGALIVYGMLIGMTATFLFAYIKRMLTIGFLIIISPLITITYSVDRINDGKAQALNTWLKEFMFTVLIQPFHCIIYIVFISTAMNLLKQGGSLPKMVLAIMCMSFIWQAEKIVKKIFGFDAASTSLPEMVSSMALVKDIGTMATKAATVGSKAVRNTSFGKNLSNKVNTTINRHPALQNMRNTASSVANTKVGKATGRIIKEGTAVAFGVTGAAIEAGAGTPANAAQVGLESHKAIRTLLMGGDGTPGSKQSIKAVEKELSRFSNLISKNNNFNFNNFTSNQTNKDNLKSYAQTLIGANMNMLNGDIQTALNHLRTVNPTEYDTNTTVGMTNMQHLMDMALDNNLDFNDATTNPLGHEWTAEEQSVVTKIQIKNLAQAVQDTHSQYQAAGKNNPAQDVDDYIQSL